MFLRRVRAHADHGNSGLLTKVMRGNDEQDMANADFMILHNGIAEGQLLAAFSQMRPIDLLVLLDAFASATPRILELARAGSER